MKNVQKYVRRIPACYTSVTRNVVYNYNNLLSTSVRIFFIKMLEFSTIAVDKFSTISANGG